MRELNKQAKRQMNKPKIDLPGFTKGMSGGGSDACSEDYSNEKPEHPFNNERIEFVGPSRGYDFDKRFEHCYLHGGLRGHPVVDYLGMYSPGLVGKTKKEKERPMFSIASARYWANSPKEVKEKGFIVPDIDLIKTALAAVGYAVEDKTRKPSMNDFNGRIKFGKRVVGELHVKLPEPGVLRGEVRSGGFHLYVLDEHVEPMVKALLGPLVDVKAFPPSPKQLESKNIGKPR